jgi:hypothetical protein
MCAFEVECFPLPVRLLPRVLKTRRVYSVGGGGVHTPHHVGGLGDVTLLLHGHTSRLVYQPSWSPVLSLEFYPPTADVADSCASSHLGLVMVSMYFQCLTAGSDYKVSSKMSPGS